MRSSKVSCITEKSVREKKIGEVETGRKRKILQKDFSGHVASRWVQRSGGSRWGHGRSRPPGWDNGKNTERIPVRTT